MLKKRQLRSRRRTGRRKSKRSMRGVKRVLSMPTSLKRKKMRRLPAPSLSQPTKQALSKWLNSKSEIKNIFDSPTNFTTGFTLTTDTLFNCSITSGDKYRLLPNVPVGTNNGQRIGLEIQPISLKVRLALTLTAPSIDIDSRGDGDTGPEDITAHIFFLKSKKFPDFANVGAISLSQLLQVMPNNGTFSAFSGAYWEQHCVVNSEDFTLIKRIQVRLKRAAGYQSYVAQVVQSGNYQPNQAIFTDNVPGGQTADIAVDIPLPKELQYRTTTDVQPQDFNPFMVVGWTKNAYPLSSAPPSTLFPLAISGRTYFRYRDS